jgi:hypothetical protein
VLESNGVTGVLLSLECGLELGRRDVADGLQEPAVVEPVDPFQGGVLEVVDALQGPRRRTSSVLYRPMIVSASALSNESPREPTEVTTPASARRSVERMARYWADSTGRRNSLTVRSCDGNAQTASVGSGGSVTNAFTWSAAGGAA